MRAFAEPPASLTPARLFRTLTQRHPERALDYRIPGAESFALRVRAVRSTALAALFDEADGGPAELRTSTVSSALLVLCLRSGEVPALSSADDLGGLPSPVVDALWSASLEALGAICPTYSLSNVRTWSRALEDGARDPSNVHDAFALAGCVDVGPTGATVPRPDRYWGCPTGDLLDGHWMAFRAARAVYLDAIKGPSR